MARRPGVLRFRRRDYLGPASISLDDAVRELVLARTGTLCSGPVRILTQLRSFGHCFNPVSFYYCFDPTGNQVEAAVAEVTNTPWGERHAYVIPGHTGTLGKALHVSPFQAMDQRYLVRVGTPDERLGVHIESRRHEAVCFDATLALRRTELTARSAARVAARYPAANLRVLALIYAHAVGLKRAGATVYPHPRPHHLTPRERA